MITLLVCLSGMAMVTFVLVLLVSSNKVISPFALAGKVDSTAWKSTAKLPYVVQSFSSAHSPKDLIGKTYSGLSKSEAELVLDWLENQPDCPKYKLLCNKDSFSIHFLATDQ